MTIKYGKGYEETWAGFTGRVDEVREDILDYFGISAEVTKALTMSELVVKATQVAHGKGNAAALLGAMPVSAPAAAAVETAPDKADPWAGVEGADESAGVAEAAPVGNPHLAAIEKCSSVEELKLWWSSNQEAYNADAEVKAAYSTKGKALKAAAQAAA